MSGVDKRLARLTAAETRNHAGSVLYRDGAVLERVADWREDTERG